MTRNVTPTVQTYTYDQENRLTGAAGYTYTYDGDGNRVRKSNGSSTGTLYWYMTPGIVGESDLSGNLTDEYVFFDGERVARKSTNGVFYYFSDHLKTASVITDSAAISRANPISIRGAASSSSSTTIPTITSSRAKNGMRKHSSIISGPGITRMGWEDGSSADWSPTPIPVPYADFSNPAVAESLWVCWRKSG